MHNMRLIKVALKLVQLGKIEYIYIYIHKRENYKWAGIPAENSKREKLRESSDTGDLSNNENLEEKEKSK